MLPRPVPGRLLETQLSQSLRGLPRPPTQRHLCGTLPRRPLHLQGLALRLFHLLPGSPQQMQAGEGTYQEPRLPRVRHPQRCLHPWVSLWLHHRQLLYVSGHSCWSDGLLMVWWNTVWSGTLAIPHAYKHIKVQSLAWSILEIYTSYMCYILKCNRYLILSLCCTCIYICLAYNGTIIIEKRAPTSNLLKGYCTSTITLISNNFGNLLIGLSDFFFKAKQSQSFLIPDTLMCYVIVTLLLYDSKLKIHRLWKKQDIYWHLSWAFRNSD